MHRPLFVLAVVLASLAACSNGKTTGPTEDQILIDGVIRRTGVVAYMNIEGGFWAIRGDDGVTYDPLGGIGKGFQRSGLRVEFEGRVRDDLAGIHMVGPIVEILTIRAR